MLGNTVTALHTGENFAAQMKYPLKKTEQVQIEKRWPVVWVLNYKDHLPHNNVFNSTHFCSELRISEIKRKRKIKLVDVFTPQVVYTSKYVM